MQAWQSIILGLVQGFTEFLPISSSGHLEIVQALMGGRSEDFHLFLECINLGTLLALLFYYRKRIIEIIVDVFKKRNYKLFINLVITTIPAVLAALFLTDLIESAGFFSSLATIAAVMGLVGVLMVLIDKLPHMKKVKDENALDKRRALYVGLAQMCALIPGVSRSGSTMIAGRIVGMDNESSANYSFLASIPIMCGVMVKSLLYSDSRAYIGANIGMLALSNALAFVAGLIVITWALKFMKRKNSLQAFGWYRIVLALIVLVFMFLL